MSRELWQQLLHGAAHSRHKSPKTAAIVMIVVGFFMAPMLIGIPIMIYGFYLLSK